eukprot:TRINITY_DN17395_c0_g1_i1.p1 TRINITY_DN17395_c0_g1~~TRINITY_DN17395_c0_g1_i1.p1  ORF type:complete len:308 (-),score=40.90 TRINITY_DN17395_c0_g1_i1:372-1295(-)
MANKRQRLARRRYREQNSQNLEDHSSASKKRKTDDDDAADAKVSHKKQKTSHMRKALSLQNLKLKLKKKDGKHRHPLRVPGSKPGEGCFICSSKEHVAKECPRKARSDSKKVCLLCRERGHTLQNCPNGEEELDAKYCYNCGDTGHRLAQCPKPVENGGTKFAKCFLCKESGHLSKNCPSNTRGIYPKGGSCKTCGSVTHLAKDCPEKKGNSAASKLKISKEPAVACKPGESGQRIVFRSGDDLEDDFVSCEDDALTLGTRLEGEKGSVTTIKPQSTFKQNNNLKPPMSNKKMVNGDRFPKKVVNLQ